MSAPAAAGGGASVESSQESQEYCELCIQDYNSEDMVGSCCGDECPISHPIMCRGCGYWDEEKEVWLCPDCKPGAPARVAHYMGREAAHQAYLAVPHAEVACLICLATKGEIEERLGAAPTPEQAAIKELAIKTTFVVPRCGAAVPHLYHRTCLKTWLKKPDHNKCPSCRGDIAGEVTPTPKPESQVSSLDSQATGGAM